MSTPQVLEPAHTVPTPEAVDLEAGLIRGAIARRHMASALPVRFASAAATEDVGAPQTGRRTVDEVCEEEE